MVGTRGSGTGGGVAITGEKNNISMKPNCLFYLGKPKEIADSLSAKKKCLLKLLCQPHICIITTKLPASRASI